MESAKFYQLFIKRAFDIIFSIILLTVLFVPFLIITICIKINSRGPVMFRHTRAGKNQKPFIVYKFRSMRVNAPKYQATNDLIDAGNYITFTGRIMRKLSIDELPQLINVLKGEMSIVGPRPVILKEKELLSLRKENGASNFKPGITGWAQVNGRDEVRIDEKAKMDGFYAENFSLLLDLKCLALTMFAVLSMKGHREGHEIEEINNFDDVSLNRLIECSIFNKDNI